MTGLNNARSILVTTITQLQLATIAKLEPFSWALTYGLKEKYRWWSLVDLSCRYFFILIVVCTAGNKVSSMSCILYSIFTERLCPMVQVIGPVC